MAEPQHPAVPFEQAVDLLTGEPRQLRPQHPDIAALAERLETVANDLGPINAETCMKAAAALRTLARPVEDEEAAKWLRRFNAYGGEFEEAASLIASLAREKASAEQEAERLRDLLRSVLRMAVLHAYSPDGSAENKAVVADAERALAAAAGAEEPR